MRFAWMAAKTAPAWLLLVVTVAWTQPDPAVQQAAEALRVSVDEAGEQWFEIVAAQPDDPDEQAFADWVLARPDFEDAVVDGDAVEATTASGVVVRFCDEQPGIKGTRGAGLGPAAGMLSTLQAAPGTLSTFGEVAPGGKALIIDPSGTIINDPGRDIQRMLEHANYTVVESAGGLQPFLGMATAGVTIISTHGGHTAGNKHFFLVGSESTSTDVRNLEEYFVWLTTGQLGLARRVKRDPVTKAPTRIVTGLDIYDTWFDRNIPSMLNNAAVFIFTCASMDPQTRMWDILRKKGASFYFGFKGSVEEGWGQDWLTRYLDRLTGANIYDPWQKDPPRRPQSFEDAFTYITRNSNYRKDPSGEAYAGFHIDFPDTYYSLAPHIDQAAVLPVRDDPPFYEVLLIGSLGLADESTVYLNGQSVPFTSTIASGGGSYRVVIPIDATGPMVVNDRWGRQSNPVMISRFTTQVEFQYDDLEMAGTVKFTYDSLVIGTRLYRRSRRGLEFGGLPGPAFPWIYELEGPPPNTAPYNFLGAFGDWAIEWKFDSTKRIGRTTITAVGQGQETGRGSVQERDAIDASLGISLTPIPQTQDATTCNAEVWPTATVGPIKVTYASRGGRKSEDKWAICAGMPATCTFDMAAGSFPEVTGPAGGGGSWKMKSVTITPNPWDLNSPACLPGETDWVRMASRLQRQDAPPRHAIALP